MAERVVNTLAWNKTLTILGLRRSIRSDASETWPIDQAISGIYGLWHECLMCA
jgi:hypothetical protein